MKASEIVTVFDLFDHVNTLWEMEVHVDVTTISKNFGKDVNDWFASDHFEKAVKKLRDHCAEYGQKFFESHKEDVMVLNLFRDETATETCAFLHSGLILEFAYWLSPDFEEWFDSDVKVVLNLNKKKDQQISKVIQAILDNEKTCDCEDYVGLD